jgi:hypothetical protein
MYTWSKNRILRIDEAPAAETTGALLFGERITEKRWGERMIQTALPRVMPCSHHPWLNCIVKHSFDLSMNIL